MSRRLYIFWTAILLSAIYQPSQAQTTPAWAMLDKILYTYSGDIAFQGHMQLSLARDPSRVIEELPASYLVAGSNMDCRLGYVEMIGTPEYFMTVDNHSRSIFITGAEKKKEKRGLIDFTAFKQKLITADATLQLDSTGENPFLLIGFKDDPQMKSCKLYYNPLTYEIDHATFEFWDEADPDDTGQIKLLNISYSGYRKPSGEEVKAITRKILTIEGRKIVPEARYRDYRIISQL